MTNGELLIEEPGQAELQDPDFLMYSYKVKPCPKKYRHDWRVCPFAHEGESAARRDPRKYKYVGVACPYAKQGKSCPRGQSCPCTHNVFEYWLHPTRFRTEICSQGTKCNRSCCFFAHTESELRKLKHQDIINSAVGDPNETCSALETYLKKTNTCDLNDIADDSDSHDSGDDAVIIMGSVPKTMDDGSSVGEEEPLVMGMAAEADGLRSTSEHMAMGYSPGEVLLRVEQTSPSPMLQTTRGYLTSPEFSLAHSPETGLVIDPLASGRYRMVSPQQELSSFQDVYMASPEPGIYMGSDGQAHLVGMTELGNQVNPHCSSPFSGIPRAGASPGPSSTLQMSGFHSPTPLGPLSASSMTASDAHATAALQEEFNQLSGSWRINRGVSFPAMLNRSSHLGSSSNLQLAGNAFKEEASLRNEFQKLSASWGVNRGATLPTLRRSPVDTRASSYLNNGVESLSSGWAMNGGVSATASLGSGLQGLSTGQMDALGSMGVSCDQANKSFVALQENMVSQPVQSSQATLSTDIASMAASWGLGKNASSLSDSYALGGGQDTWIGAGRVKASGGPPPGFGGGRPSFELPETSVLGDMSFLQTDGFQSYIPSGRLVERNWTFGGNGRVV